MTPNGGLSADNSHGGQKPAKPLEVVIVGAGIGGLSAAILLRQQGHHVTLLEQSRFANELGAAVHIAPNADGLLLRMGLDVAASGAVPCNLLTTFKPNGETLFQVPVWRQKPRWQHRWLLAHRVDLHSELKRLATTEEGKGTPAVLKSSSKVSRVTTDGTVTLASGEQITADLVVGADGVHSKTRYALPGSEGIKIFGSGKSAFRFLMPRSRALEDPVTRPLVEAEGHLALWFGRDRRVVIYPTRNHELLNFVCIHPTKDSEVSPQSHDSADWQKTGHLDKLLEVYKDFDPAVVKLLSMADEDTLKVWELLDMEKLPTWTEGRLALIGDAAHPFTPHQGQGAAQAIEDAASLACVLPLGTLPSEIPERMKIYEKCRYDRAFNIQEYSRIAGRDLGDGPPLDSTKYTNENFGYDEWHYSSQKLREWEWSRKPDAYKRMPVPFGPFPGPRQDHLGNQRDWSAATFSTASIRFRTSRTLLQNLFPTPAFRFASPDTNCFATFSLSALGNLPWLGGHGYNHFGLYIHGVEYTNENGEKVTGTYLPVLFENLADPIVSGREELGMPKVFSNLDIVREADSLRLTAGWMGNNFLDLSLTGLVEKGGDGISQGATAPPNGKEEGLLFYKHIPVTGPASANNWGADVEYAAIVPNAEEAKAPKRVERTLAAGKADINFNKLDWQKLPTLYHIVARLAEIPVYEVVEAKIVEGTGGSDVRGVKRL
ncbi:FAD/NAD(P)-binding domain-containing protein [Byssothecium circinans]|uniref:FAD/NAD(P)-binding domain-containing protein n=1 Tax=Byssothecium circinans TaxID=147558 RepID=A0A6A5UFR7_9PLEO|nr:FAD/NAD(P)-binding domain-containing protein [Byssothecium circinans]